MDRSTTTPVIQWIPPRRYQGLPSNLLVRLATRARWAVGSGLEGVALSKYQYALLAALEDDEPASQADLSRRTGIDRSDIVAVVNDLEARQAIVRLTDPADRRRNLISMTPAGVELLETLQRIIDAAQDELLVHLSVGERAQLVHLLQRALGDQVESSRDE